MEIIKTAIEGVVIIEPRLFKDDRGYFFESFSQREFTEKVRKVDFVQDNESKSSYGVLRGLHFQKPPYAQSKLVRVIKGSVLDVAVDIRKGSPTFGEHVSVELTEENHRQFFIPRGFAHGFVVLTEEVIFQCGIIPSQGTFTLGSIEVVTFILKDNLFRQDNKAMGESTRNKELTVVFFCQFHRYMLSKCW